MPITKWVMKQYWRVGTIRALLSLGMSMFVIGSLYYQYIPWLQNLDLLGALIFSSILFLFFLGLGWLYDTKAYMWSPKTQAYVERIPFRYVPDYRSATIEYAFHFALMKTIGEIFKKLDLESTQIIQMLEYLGNYFDRVPERGDILEAEKDSKIFMEKYPFVKRTKTVTKKPNLTSKIKLAFEINILRITWIQSLTGLVQDVLVFGAFYGVFLIPLLFPNATESDYLFLVIFYISLPIFVVLLLIGWLYDRQLKVWTADIAVKIERNPFSYVSEPMMYSFIYPIFQSILVTLRDVFEKLSIDTSSITDALEYLDEYSRLSVKRDEDLDRAKELRKEFGDVFKPMIEVVE